MEGRVISYETAKSVYEKGFNVSSITDVFYDQLLNRDDMPDYSNYGEDDYDME
jgi:hypothetical protein